MNIQKASVGFHSANIMKGLVTNALTKKKITGITSECVRSVFYQSEGAQDGQTLHVGQTQLHETQTDDQTVKDVPALLKVIIRIQSDDLQNHLSCEDACEHLRTTAGD